MGAADQLRAADPAAWAAATSAPFLDGVATGTLAEGAFATWLVQDRLFVQALVRAWGLLLQSAPAQDLPLLAAGIGAFTDELGWFEGLATTDGLDLAQPPTAATAAYCTALQDLAGRPYPVAIAAMWAVEEAYLASWQGVADRWGDGGTPAGATRYVEHVTHWADEGFAAFVAQLAAVVDRELPDGPTPAAAGAVAEVLAHESAFWSMTTGSAGPGA